MTRSIRHLTSRQAVLEALALYDRFGQEQFLHQFGFGRSYRYQLVHEGREYDSKAVAGVAFGIQHPEEGHLDSSEFSGGTSGAAFVLGRLGFQIRTVGGAAPAARITTSRLQPAARPAVTHPAPSPSRADVLLLGCVKTKQPSPAPARDLYVSDLFRKRRAHAEASGLPWFILSAQHGLVVPGEVLDPYDMALAQQPAQYRARWGQQVTQQLLDRLGSLRGVTFELHAGAAYVEPLREPMGSAGARLSLPLAGLAQGEQLAWYLRSRPVPEAPVAEPPASETDAAVAALSDLAAARSPDGFPWGRRGLHEAGLYAWHVDEQGATALSRGVGLPLAAGLVYAGQAGATAWPSGTLRTSTLASRIGGNHLRGRISGSTWRLTLAALLEDELTLEVRDGQLSASSSARLTEWMTQRLRLCVHPVHDRDGLSVLEAEVLAVLEPPLNLEGMPRTPVRRALSALRSGLQLR